MPTVKAFISSCAVLLSFSVYAEEHHKELQKSPDPGDHTRVSTIVSATYGVQSIGEANNNKVMFLGQRSGSKANGNYFLGQLSLTGQENGKVGSEDFNLSQVRARYFEVTPIESETAPMAGLSFDYIDTSFTDGPSKRLFAFGGVVRLDTPFKNWLSFPNLAVAYGQNNEDFGYKGLVDEHAWGGQLNLMNTFYLHKNGSNVQFNPQFSMMDMGGDMGTFNSLQLEFVVQMPISSNRKHWGKVTYNEFLDDISQDFGHNELNTEVKFTYTYYL